jgi:hypothetical protein
MSVATASPRPTLRDDLAYGEANETNINGRLNQTFGATLVRRGGYNIFDYVGRSDMGKTIEVELKTRRIAHDKYATALIGRNKIEYCSNPETDYYFAFSYLDGIYYIKYDPALFASFESRDDFVRSEREDTPTVNQSVIYIPTNLLSRM